MDHTTWGTSRISSYSAGANNCVEAAHAVAADTVGVWDTKRRDNGPLVVTGHRWTTFIAQLKAGRFAS